MNIMFLDTETTGLPNWKEPSDHPEQPFVVDLAYEIWSGDTLAESFDRLVNIGTPIPADMTAIHGITDEMVQAEGVSIEDAVTSFMDATKRVDLIAGHNVSFDIRMMRIMAAKAFGEKWDNPHPVFCTMRKSTNHCRLLGPKARHPEDWKWPSLTEAVRHFFDEDHSTAHRARPDVEASRRIYFHLKSLEN